MKKEKKYSIDLNFLTAREYHKFPDSFKEYSYAALLLLRRKKVFLLEEDILTSHMDDAEIENLKDNRENPMNFIRAKFPYRFADAGRRLKSEEGGEYAQAWFDLFSEYIILPQEIDYDLFFVYKLRHTDLLELDNFLNYTLGNYYNDNVADFIRFVKLVLRKHGKKLLQPEQTETINEWIAEKEKEVALSGTIDTKTKGKIKRERDDKVTLLNQEQTALLIHCLRKTKIILIDEFLNNKEAGQAFSILTGYSADTLRQNLNKSETANIATIKNVEVVEKALKEVLKYIEKQVKPEQ